MGNLQNSQFSKPSWKLTAPNEWVGMGKILLRDSNFCAAWGSEKGGGKWGAHSAAAWTELFSSLVIQCCSWLECSVTKTFLLLVDFSPITSGK